MDKLHIIQTVFTGRGIPKSEEETLEWLERRIELFKKYTLPSLLNQTNKDFLHWISFRESNKQVLELANYLTDLKYNFIFTFAGQPYWDDCGSNDDTLDKRFETDLLILEKYRKDWIYFTVLDSDDMFHKDVVAEIQKEEPAKRKALIYQKGYIYNDTTGKLAEWFCNSPPFYTIIYPAEVFFNAKIKSEYNSTFRSHEDIIKIFSCKLLTPYRYCVVIHKNNKSTYWEHKFKGQEYSQTKKILKNFGIK